VGGVLGLTAVGGALTYFVVNTDRDIPGVIDDERVLEVTIRECRLMTSTVEGVLVGGPQDERLDALSDQNTAVETMIDRIRTLSPNVREADKPLDSWLADWQTLVAEREDYLGRQRHGIDSDFRVPRTRDGDPINERMDLAAEDCPVPEVLLKPHLAGTQPI
jgi:hypothetical protein